MKQQTMQEVGLHVKALRRKRGWTQATLAERLGVGRDWVVRLEQGAPRLEAQRVLDALNVLGASLASSDEPGSPVADADPFAAVFERLDQ